MGGTSGWDENFPDSAVERDVELRLARILELDTFPVCRSLVDIHIRIGLFPTPNGWRLTVRYLFGSLGLVVDEGLHCTEHGVKSSPEHRLYGSN